MHFHYRVHVLLACVSRCRFIAAAPEGLQTLLASLPQDKYIFTNCAEKQAEVRKGNFNRERP
jgi:hypothetical protein